ncbi:MAG: L-serine ammonia-lyase, iron-sulfur-dependent subunit beta, partial [Angelakisella sp.]
FDIIGPNMIGPSSSHTAGALRIALLAGKLVQGQIVSADFTLYGSFAKTYRGHGTDRALLGGILGFDTEDKRIKDSFDWAQRAGLRYSFTENTEKTDVHPNTVDILLKNDAGRETRVTGVSIGGGRVNIKRINGVKIDFSGEYNTIIVRHLDSPGMVAYITRCLSEYDINIAYMRMYRDSKGENAYSIIEADGEIAPAVIERIAAHEKISEALLINRG